MEEDISTFGKDVGEPTQRVFAYDVRALLTIRAIVITALVCLSGAMLVRIVPQGIETYRYTDPGVFAGFVLVGLAMVGSLPVMFYFIFVPALNDGLRRRNERICIDPDGLTFEDGSRTIRASWNDVQALYLERTGAGRKRVVVTPDGEFQYTQAVRGADVLDGIIRNCAVNARIQAFSEGDVIRRAPTPASVRVHDYRNRTTRALLAFALALILALITIALMDQAGMGSGSRRPAPLWASALGLAAWACLVWRYRTVAVITNAIGLTRTGPFGRTVMPWAELTTFRMRGSDVCRYGEVVGSRATIRFWIGISECEALKAEIEAHVTR